FRLGLLVPMEHHESDGHLLCKKHSLSEDVKARKKKFDIMIAYEEKRMVGIRRKRIGPDEERKRARQLEEYTKRMKSFEGVNVLHPGPNNAKRQRLFQSSAEVIEAFALKAELLMGINRETYIKEFEKIPPENLNLAGELSFTEDSVRYLEYRENVQFDEYEQYAEELKESKEEIIAKEKQLTEEVNGLKENHQTFLNSTIKIKNDLDYLFDQLNALGAKGISRAYGKLPKKFAPVPTIKDKKKQVTSKPPVLKPKLEPDLITLSDEEDDGPPVLKPNLPSKVDVKTVSNQPSKFVLPKLTRISSTSTGSPSVSPSKSIERVRERPKPVPKPRNKSVPDPSIPRICQTCKKDTDPQQMPFCEGCNHFYHIGCLDPPLDKVPKPSRFYKWTCSDCNDEEAQKGTKEEPSVTQSTDTTVETIQESDEENQTLAQNRKPRERATAIRVAREADYQELEARNKRNSTSEVSPTLLKKRRLSSPRKPEKDSPKIMKNDEVNAEMNGFHTEA
uniref:PHD-type domain-containing protein n=1 Tax=Panagrolaimus sp. JU765 TaxID=591449 RepID=A0AC34R4Q8_9BILA